MRTARVNIEWGRRQAEGATRGVRVQWVRAEG